MKLCYLCSDCQYEHTFEFEEIQNRRITVEEGYILRWHRNLGSNGDAKNLRRVFGDLMEDDDYEGVNAALGAVLAAGWVT